MARVCSCTGHLTNPGGKCCMDLGSGASTPFGGGYTCNGCGMWVQNGTTHTCNTTWPRPAPYTPPTAPLPITIQPGVSEERVRELIREALDEFRKDELKRARRSG